MKEFLIELENIASKYNIPVQYYDTYDHTGRHAKKIVLEYDEKSKTND